MAQRTPIGCGQAAATGALVLWFGVVPLAVTGVLAGAAGTVGAAPGLEVSLVAPLLALPLAVALGLARRRRGWELTAALAAALLTAAGYVVLEALIRALFPASTAPDLHGEGAAAAAVRLGLLLSYACLAGWLAPRLAGAPKRPIWEWLGLSRPDWPTLLLALAASALLTVPWPLTGALGDRLTTLSLALHTLAWALPQALIFWGVLFCLLTSSTRRPLSGALLLLAVYALAGLGNALPGARWGALQDLVWLLPLALLLTELRARGDSIVPGLLLALCYRLARLAFVDPRDALAQTIPEAQHIVSQTIVIVAAAAVALMLWLERRVRLARHAASAPRPPDPRRARNRILTWVVVAMLAWGLWAALYLTLGQPGFADDGFLIILSEQADLSPAYAIAERDTRLEYVYRTLVATADRTQAPLLAELDTLGVDYRRYYLINMIRVDGHRWLMRRFEGRATIAQVILNPNVRQYPRRVQLPYGEDVGASDAVQPNLSAIGADDAWRLGETGEGIVVAGQDTGYDWTHPALKARYRGWDGTRATHDYNWHDAWEGRAEPFDEDSHGTHTMGTVLGDDGGSNRIGVAPGARWIGCRNMQRGFGNPGAYAECMEFFLAPYPLGGDPFSQGDVSQAPHVVNNSWGCPDFEGCFPDTLQPAVEALRAAGIMMVVSAGNEGPACLSVTDPPAIYDAAFSVGATGESGAVAPFSSRGPVGDLLKPDVSAPGSSVRSSVPGGGYGYASGTSMAGPHVAGLVALLWSADPALIGDIDATEALICATARPRPVEDLCTLSPPEPDGALTSLFSNPICACGDVTGTLNNVYGCGIIDAEAAVLAALAE